MWPIVSGVIIAVLALAGTVATVVATFRSSSRSTDAERERAFDQRVDAELTRLRDALETMTAERDRYREQFANLRIDVIEAGLDPDHLDKGVPPDEPAPAS